MEKFLINFKINRENESPRKGSRLKKFYDEVHSVVASL